MSVKRAIDVNDSKEKLACVFGKWMIKSINFPTEIYDFIQFKVTKNLNKVFDFVNETFQLMLQDGMTYYTRDCYKNVIECEMNVFANMLDIIHLWGKADLLIFNSAISNYILMNKKSNLNLRGINLMSALLNGAFLKNADLINTNLEGADLINANLEGADLRNANLKRANLRNANLCRADLDGADLEGANLSEVDLRGVDLQYVNFSRANLERANLEGAKIRNVNLRKTILKGSDMRGVSLKNSNLSGADLRNANLKGANLEASIWYASDTRRALSQLRTANFTYLMIREDNETKKVERSELFPEEYGYLK